MGHWVAGCSFMLMLGAGFTPAFANNPTVEDSLKSRSDLSMFYQALVDTGVAAELEAGSDYTIFAPTNEAFEKISKEKYPCFYSPECKKEVAEILRNHIVPGAIFVSSARTKSLYSINDNRPVQLASPHRDNFSVDGNAITYTMSFTSGILYKIDGVIADRTELSALTRLPAQNASVPVTTDAEPAVITGEAPEAAPASAQGTLAPAGR